ncbi:hypothetical protein SDC9_141526 [bioreactor metagenome]|uniref:Uncharacterized protein n=1 Tax=bioreactor metagenome TaxID=1076179 RepID=A0A645DXY7_9ZZZZ
MEMKNSLIPECHVLPKSFCNLSNFFISISSEPKFFISRPNSSPPSLAAKSGAVTYEVSLTAIYFNNSSPIICPIVSLTYLKLSISINTIANLSNFLLSIKHSISFENISLLGNPVRESWYAKYLIFSSYFFLSVISIPMDTITFLPLSVFIILLLQSISKFLPSFATKLISYSLSPPF